MRGAGIEPQSSPAVIVHDPTQDQPIAKKSDLFGVFRAAEKPRAEFRVGAEVEKAGVFADGAADSLRG